VDLVAGVGAPLQSWSMAFWSETPGGACMLFFTGPDVNICTETDDYELEMLACEDSTCDDMGGTEDDCTEIVEPLPTAVIHLTDGL
jgi:hypothetical protein